MAFTERGTVMIVVPMVLWVLAFTALILRYVAHYVRQTAFDLSDLLAGISCVLMLGLAIILVLFVTNGGGGRHLETLEPQQIQTFFVVFYASQLNYFVLTPILKASLVVFYRKLFPTTIMKRITTALLAVLGAWFVATVLVAIFQCTPVAKAWNVMLPGTCINTTAFLDTYQVVNIIFDFGILVMPIPVIWNIQRPTRERVALLGLFALGGFGVAAAIVRAVTLSQIDMMDVTYSIFEAAVWTSVEPSVLLICACLPHIRGLFRVSRPNSSSRYNYASGRVNGGSYLRSRSRTTGKALDVDDNMEMGSYEIMVSHEVQVSSTSGKE